MPVNPEPMPISRTYQGPIRPPIIFMIWFGQVSQDRSRACGHSGCLHIVGATIWNHGSSLL